jgi:hypothetical protein
MLALRDLQVRFFGSLTTAPGPEAARAFDPALLQLVAPGERLAPAEGLDIYAQMYWARLHDVVRDDFPRVVALLGPEEFSRVVRAYLAQYPSTHPSVRHVGRAFAAFLAASQESPRLPFLADLARLEWARLAVFDAPDAATLRVDDLHAVAVEAWPELTFQLVPALQLVHSAWPVHALWARDHDECGDAVRPAETHLRVWRDGAMVYQAPMDACERAALACVVAGEPFAALCSVLDGVCGPEMAAHEAARLVLRWVDDGILARP